MSLFRFSTVIATAILWSLPGAFDAVAQSALPGSDLSAAPEMFTADNAILDTSIPFAIGAREAEQELRSAFGWPTFQEGLVEGVYFRIDPDGYARFSPTPRLDTDVFEVVCRPGVASCMGRKDRLSVYLGSTGLIEIKISDVAPGDTFFITDGLTETPVPDRILMPLDLPLETLLAYGGELIVRRGNDISGRVSLKGFGPVVAYLRWVAARQDYAVLPRDWPIPGAAPVTAGAAPRPAAAPVFVPVAAPAAPEPMPGAPTPPAAIPPSTLGVPDQQHQDLVFRLVRLEAQVAALQAQVSAPAPATVALPAAPAPVALAEPASPPSAPMPASPAIALPPAMSDQLAYLVYTLGFDVETASLILQMRASRDPSSVSASRLVEDILSASAPPSGGQIAVPPAPVPPAAQDGFVSLSEYLRAVTPP
jgi:hypothetical protein